MTIRPRKPRSRGVSLLEATIAMAILAAAALALVTSLEAGRAREREAELRLDALDAAEALLQESLRKDPADARRLDGTVRAVPGHAGVEATLSVQPSTLALPGFTGDAPGLLATVTVREPRASGPGPAREILRLERFRVVAEGAE
jgi:type II secretory pathway pseudopilin PulG